MTMASASAPHESALEALVSAFGAAVLPKLGGPGQEEDALRGPTENLLISIAQSHGLTLVPHGEAHLADAGTRPDYAISVNGSIIGYLELKSPGKGADPEQWGPKTHDGKQWVKLKNLPNLIYTDGQSWARFSFGKRQGDICSLSPNIRSAGSKLSIQGTSFPRLLNDFLHWEPIPPRNISDLVRSISGLCRLLRTEVLEAIVSEETGTRPPLFTSLAADWKELLFPDATNEQFADRYAQTVTFALLLARVEKIPFKNRTISAISSDLGKTHSLMGQALRILTDDSLGDFGTSLQVLHRVVGVVDWDKLDDGSGDAYLHLYEEFLAQYDPELRKDTGSYYTPNEVVSFMVSFTDEILRVKMHKALGFASPEVVVVDPAMGTGTFLLNVIEKAAKTILAEEGEGAVGSQVAQLATRLIGFEKQAGPYAVAELRMYDALHKFKSELTPGQKLRIYVADSLDDPEDQARWIPSTYGEIAKSRSEANKLKREDPVMVVIGNPPYKERAKSLGGWIVNGRAGEKSPIADFKKTGLGQHEFNLNNLYVYFWRWAAWKVFDAHPQAPSGIVSYITLSTFLTAKGLSGMREYMRRTADEGWIIDLSPEGFLAPVPSRVFSGVKHKICIAVFVRYGEPNPNTPAKIHYLSLSPGGREQKFQQLDEVEAFSDSWQECGTGWTDAFLPDGDATWESHPSLGDLMPFYRPGIIANRTWVYSPSGDSLRKRWNALVAAPSAEAKRKLFKESDARKLESVVAPVPGLVRHRGAIGEEQGDCPTPVPVGFRSFDRQFVIPDTRLLHRPAPDLWRVAGDSQVFAVEQHAQPLTNGPGIVFTPYVPDVNHFKGSSAGRALPLFRDPAGSVPNFASGLIALLANRLGCEVQPSDLLSYIAAVVAHSGYTTKFSTDLATPGVRIPLTADPEVWRRAVEIGKRAIWLHTFGERFAEESEGRPNGRPRVPVDGRPKNTVAIPATEQGMPDTVDYDPLTETLIVGEGKFNPVRPEVWHYEVSGMKVVKKWVGYRLKNPIGRRSSELDEENPKTWPSEFTTDLLDLLNVLTLAIDLEPIQQVLLDNVLAGPLITSDDLLKAGVTPAQESDKKPLISDLQSLDNDFEEGSGQGMIVF